MKVNLFITIVVGFCFFELVFSQIFECPPASPGSQQFYAHPIECNKFIQCNDKQAVVLACPTNFYWNANKLKCDWRFNVVCPGDDVEEEVKPTPPSIQLISDAPTRPYEDVTNEIIIIRDCDDYNGTNIAHPLHCNLYLGCDEGESIVFECVEGLYFNPAINNCDYPENVDCPATEEPPETTTPETTTPETTIPDTTTPETTTPDTTIPDTTTPDTTIPDITTPETTTPCPPPETTTPCPPPETTTPCPPSETTTTPCPPPETTTTPCPPPETTTTPCPPPETTTTPCPPPETTTTPCPPTETTTTTPCPPTETTTTTPCPPTETTTTTPCPPTETTTTPCPPTETSTTPCPPTETTTTTPCPPPTEMTTTTPCPPPPETTTTPCPCPTTTPCPCPTETPCPNPLTTDTPATLSTSAGSPIVSESPPASLCDGICATGLDYLPNPTNCGKFIRCVHCIAYEMNCPRGLLWNKELIVCDWPYNVKC